MVLSGQSDEGSQVEGAEGRWSGGRVKGETSDRRPGRRDGRRAVEGHEERVPGRESQRSKSVLKWARGSGYGVVVVRELGSVSLLRPISLFRGLRRSDLQTNCQDARRQGGIDVHAEGQWTLPDAMVYWAVYLIAGAREAAGRRRRSASCRARCSWTVQAVRLFICVNLCCRNACLSHLRQLGGLGIAAAALSTQHAHPPAYVIARAPLCCHSSL